MPKTLLLADDSVVIQKLVGLSFANEDVEILTADNGDDAVATARSQLPDAVIADVIMPGKSGYEVCEAIKQDPQLAHIPVLLLTGTFEAFDEERAKAVGSEGHITKPFEAQALVDRVNELFATSARPASQPAEATRPTATPPVVEVEPAAAASESFDFFDDDISDLANLDIETPVESTTDPLAEPLESLDEATPLDALGAAEDLDAGLLGSDSTVALMPEDGDDAGSDLSAGLVDLESYAEPGSGSATVLAEDLFDGQESDSSSDWLSSPAAETLDAGDDVVLSVSEQVLTATDGDATVLADDLFDPPPQATIVELAESDDPASLPPLEPSEELVVEATPAEASLEPTRSDYDISSSDLEVAADLPELDPDAAAPLALEPPPVRAASAASISADIAPAIRERLHETMEKVAWEAFSELSENVVRQVLERVETIAWEVIPQLTEAMVREEIRRMKGEGEDESGS